MSTRSRPQAPKPASPESSWTNLDGLVISEATRPEAEPNSGSASGATAQADRPARGRWLRAIGTGIAVLVVALLPLRLWVAEPLRIVSDSMSETLVRGDHVLTWKLGAADQTWQRGDVISFERQGELLIKRVVGVGGDRVALRDGVLFVNGKRVDEPYTDPIDIDSVYFGPVSVPEGTVFVMGDNRRNSDDSRDYGAVPTSDVEGRVVAVIWPLGHFQTGEL
jgi:signal peptidase I